VRILLFGFSRFSTSSSVKIKLKKNCTGCSDERSEENNERQLTHRPDATLLRRSRVEGRVPEGLQILSSSNFNHENSKTDDEQYSEIFVAGKGRSSDIHRADAEKKRNATSLLPLPHPD
jgi:hypothetical protein